MATAVRSEKKKLRATEEKKVNVGRVVQVIGPVLDVEFESGHLPELYSALRIRGKTDAGANIDVVVEVQQHIGRNQVRAVAMSSTDAVAGRSYRNGKPHAYGPQRTAVAVLLFSYLRPSDHVSVSELGGLGRP